MTDLNELGAWVMVVSPGGSTHRIQVISQSVILDSMMGFYYDDVSVDDYMRASVDSVTGTHRIDYNRIHWYSGDLDNMEFDQIATHAIKHGYDKVILEHVSHLDTA